MDDDKYMACDDLMSALELESNEFYNLVLYMFNTFYSDSFFLVAFFKVFLLLLIVNFMLVPAQNELSYRIQNGKMCCATRKQVKKREKHNWNKIISKNDRTKTFLI